MYTTITIATFGTFCDIKLTNLVVQKLLRCKYKINYIFPHEGSSQKIINDRIEYFDFKISDYIDIKDAEFVNNPLQIKYLRRYPGYIYYIKYGLQKLMKKALENSSYLLVHYPALSIVSLVKEAVDANIRTGVFWVYPQYPNETYPPMMSKSIVNINFKNDQSRETKDFYVLLNLTYIETGERIYDIFFRRCETFVMIEKLLLKAPSNVYSSQKVIQLGGMVSHEIIKPKNKELVDFVKNQKSIIYVSFGTYTNLKVFDKNTIHRLIALGHSILHHNGHMEGNFPEKRYMSYNDFISHEWLIPKCSYVFSSGSLCMTTIANYHGVPIIYFPVLYEQLFWAKLYKERTGIPYIYNTASNTLIINSLKKSKNKEATFFIKKLSKEMKRKNNPVDTLVEKVRVSLSASRLG